MSDDTIETILVPSDLSDCAPGVVRRAATLAAALGAELVLMHSYEVPAGLEASAPVKVKPGSPEVTAADHLRSGVHDKMPSLVAIAEEVGVPIRTLIVQGQPEVAILSAAEDLGADLIVMGTHGRRGFNRLLLGSVAESVMRRADVPVMTVRSRWHEGCEAKNCATCTTHLTNQAMDVNAELDG